MFIPQGSKPVSKEVARAAWASARFGYDYDRMYLPYEDEPLRTTGVSSVAEQWDNPQEYVLDAYVIKGLAYEDVDQKLGRSVRWKERLPYDVFLAIRDDWFRRTYFAHATDEELLIQALVLCDMAKG